MAPRPVRAVSLRCISSCLAFRFRSSVASNSLFYWDVSMLEAVMRIIGAYSGDDLLDALLMTFHLEESLDLADGQVLPVAQSDQLIKSA